MVARNLELAAGKEKGMEPNIYYRGQKGIKYGIWSVQEKEYRLGIAEDTPMLAEARLAHKTGHTAMELGAKAKALPKEGLDIKIVNLAERISAAGKEIARDEINKDYLLEGRYHDTIYVTSDSGYESITIGDTSSRSKKGHMLLYTNNTPRRNSFPSERKIAALLWKVVNKEMLETGEGKAAYWDAELIPMER